jgi:hypothetical protein
VIKVDYLGAISSVIIVIDAQNSFHRSLPL